MPDSAKENLLVLSHKIRLEEHALAVAQRRKKLSNLSLIFGPLLILLLYAIFWVPQIPSITRTAIYIPAIPIALAFCVSAFHLKRRPGYPEGNRTYRDQGDIELALARLQDSRKLLVADVDTPTKVRRITYKEDAFSEINKLRADSKQYRRVNNILQGILIVGALAATGLNGIGELNALRWTTLTITFSVGLASGFMGYYKYKERSFYLQQTADAIETEWEAVEIGVGRYKRSESEELALADFVEEVHRLKSEQKKRQQNLEQPPESRDPND
ncbi:SLATT domain-containing protein [Salinispora fenicalii]|uniref:SLATT domain-containing protein n=1 Tax=Salinispora fenicalii TaxID=1137263 RepID=UPI0012BC5E4B|nr:SLATT domain-containing protein [Salinispora fenicalii]